MVSIAPAAPAKEPKTLSTKLTWRDVLGAWAVRWDIGRHKYIVEPGLYRVGAPDAESPVLVTANYKLTVDALRRELGGLDVWILVLDTRGVNVWCAAGKGTFGTAELVRMVKAVNLSAVVRHRTLVLPQLGATGVAAHEVSRATGFVVHYGPVRAADVPAYLAAKMHATPEMRVVTFNWRERLVVTPVEIVGSWKVALIALLVFTILELLRYQQLSWHVAADVAPVLGALLTGSVLVPLLLPWLPFRAFSLKGAVAGGVFAAGMILLLGMGVFEAAGTVLLALAICSYMAMMFTGSTTYTTLAGVQLEVRRAMPLIRIAAVTGVVLRVAAEVVQ